MSNNALSPELLEFLFRSFNIESVPNHFWLRFCGFWCSDLLSTDSRSFVKLFRRGKPVLADNDAGNCGGSDPSRPGVNSGYPPLESRRRWGYYLAAVAVDTQKNCPRLWAAIAYFFATLRRRINVRYQVGVCPKRTSSPPMSPGTPA